MINLLQVGQAERIADALFQRDGVVWRERIVRHVTNPPVFLTKAYDILGCQVARPAQAGMVYFSIRGATPAFFISSSHNR